MRRVAVPRNRRARLVALAIGLALPAAGCGSGSQAASSGAASTPAAAGPPHVVMRDLEFNPTAVRARVGQEATWANADSSPHNVRYVSGPRFQDSPTIRPGGRFALRLTQAGTIQYYCSLHPWMKATIVVSP
ncbi:MAG TPA: plastocyanin/azurin family copper-binding protein [Solirubrobacteraceae bacterium]|nr:plastocyanin/azurin family copper-binding protein [Solirubrobacteraceae bacterium]